MPVHLSMATDAATARDLTWRLSPACPADWAVHLERCGGGFFHTPPGLRVAAPTGEAVYARLLDGVEVVGIAAGVRRRCRFSFNPRHWTFPTLPALNGLPVPETALGSLVEALRHDGAAEVEVGSFDARWEPAPSVPRPLEGARREYVVPLTSNSGELVARFHTSHRRHVARGLREGWEFHLHQGSDALALLQIVQYAAARRAAVRGAGFEVLLPAELVATPVQDLAAPWGTATFGAWQDDLPLAAALIGWANRRSFYLIGGSTPEGYERGAAAWLQWRIMSLFGAHGATSYNLGSTAAGAEAPDHPEQGLHAFKSRFGGEIVTRRGAKWQLRSGHLRTHRIVRWVSKHVPV